MMTGVWIGLGSNLGDRLEQVRTALRLLDQHPGIKVIRASDAYQTAAVGMGDQPDFINGVAELEVQLPAAALLEHLLALEHQMGRRRSSPIPQPRCIDLDLLLYRAQILNTPRLTLPHPEMHRRAFVLAPLKDLYPELVIPGKGRVHECLDAIDEQIFEHLIDAKLWQS